MKILTIDKSLKQDFLNKTMTLKEISKELFKSGFFNYIPDDIQTLDFIGVQHGQR